MLYILKDERWGEKHIAGAMEVENGMILKMEDYVNLFQEVIYKPQITESLHDDKKDPRDTLDDANSYCYNKLGKLSDEEVEDRLQAIFATRRDNNCQSEEVGWGHYHEDLITWLVNHPITQNWIKRVTYEEYV